MAVFSPKKLGRCSRQLHTDILGKSFSVGMCVRVPSAFACAFVPRALREDIMHA